MALGVSCYSFLIGTMSSLLQAIDTKGHLLAEKFRLVNEFCNQGRIDPYLKEKMKRAIEYRANNYYFALFETNSLLEELPPKLKYKVLRTENLADRDEHAGGADGPLRPLQNDGSHLSGERDAASAPTQSGERYHHLQQGRAGRSQY